MKAIILAVAVLASATLNAQNLKDLLYGGKLKSDTGSTVRKTDDLSTKIDSNAYNKAVEARRLQEEATKKELIASGVDSVQATIIATGGDTTVTTPGAPPAPKSVKENNATWKFYIDELVGLLRTEVMPNKKIKEGSYAVLVEYEIGEDGGVTVVTVSSDPGNSFLEDQIKQRITLSAPKLAPIIANGKPRKIIRKQLISLSK